MIENNEAFIEEVQHCRRARIDHVVKYIDKNAGRIDLSLALDHIQHQVLTCRTLLFEGEMYRSLPSSNLIWFLRSVQCKQLDEGIHVSIGFFHRLELFTDRIEKIYVLREVVEN